MTETPIQRLRSLLETAQGIVNDGDRPRGVLGAAIQLLNTIEADAAVGAAVRECEDLGLHLSGGFYDDANAFLVWAHGDHDGVVPGPTIPAALASWKERNEMQA